MRHGKTLEQFAKRIETHIRKSGNVESMEKLICRLLTGDDPKVAAILATKWVTWRFGEPTQKHIIEGHFEHEHFRRLSDEELAQYRAIAERAYLGSDPGRELPA
jgi:hypothetical protein